MAKFSFFILPFLFSQIVFAANGGSTCRKSTTSQIKTSYPEICRADFKAGKCEEKKQREIAVQKIELTKKNASEEELALNLKKIDEKYAQCTPAEYDESAKAKVQGCLGAVEEVLKEYLVEMPQALIEKMKDADACRKDISTKTKALEEMNASLSPEQKLHLVSKADLRKPEFSQARKNLNFITPDRLEKMTCGALEERMRMHLSKMRTQLTPEQKNQLRSQMGSEPSPALLDQAKQMFVEMGLPSNCLSPRAYMEAVCIGAIEIGSLAFGGALAAMKAARMMKLSKLTGKTTKELEAKLAELQKMGRDKRIAKAKTEIEPLTPEQKAKLVQSELGLRSPLNSKQSAAVEKAHLEGAQRGEGYGSYSGDTLREKKRILMNEGGFSELQADYMINRGIVGGSPSNGVMTVEKVKALGDEATKNRLLGEMASQKASVRNGVVDQPEAQQYFQKAGQSLEDKLAKDPDATSMQRAAKARMANIENYVIDTKMEFPKDRPEIARKYSEFERHVIPTQRKYEEAATSYIRAGKKEDALRVLNKSPVVSGLSNSTGKQNYIQRFMREAEVSRSPASK